MLLPGDSAAEAELAAAENPAIVAAAHPTASVAWAALAEDALADDKAITAYAYAAPAITAAWISCAATDGRVSGRFRTATNPTAGSCAVWPRWRGPRTRSARTTSIRAAWICSTTAIPPPDRHSGWPDPHHRSASHLQSAAPSGGST